ncbi:MAG: TetR family transcriptional regulator [Myxococcota bacterium]
MATRLFAEQGYEATTLRRVATEAGVSPGLLYRYFPSKPAVVLELYGRLSEAFAARTERLPTGSWFGRFDVALTASLETLRDHRGPLRATLLVMLADPETGLFSPAAADTRRRVRDRFVEVVTGAADAPEPAVAMALGRLLDLAQLGVILWWMMDRSPEQRATWTLLAWIRGLAGPATAALWLPGTGAAIRQLEALAADALYGEGSG